MIDRKKLEALLQWMFQSIGEDLKALVVVDREGLVIASLLKEGLNEEEDIIGGMAALVEPVLKRISSEFKSGNFGTGSFDTDKNRLIFCEAGPDAILVLVADMLASLDRMFPYAYLCAEKITRIFDGRVVSPVIPDFSNEKGKLQGSKDINQILLEEGSFVLKTVLCGAGGVGKTTLVTQFVQSSFQEDYKSTIGVSIMKKAVEFEQWNAEVRLTIFDLAGQQQFIKVRQTYFQGARAGFLIYDVTRRETFDEMENWYNETKKVEPEVMLILVANKIDLESERKVSKEEGKALADKLKVPYLETSALNKDIVDEAFKTLAFLFIKDRKQMKILN
ncbi:MAG: GTP-binding protein [Candidatus Helarchaeota archaeon]